MIYAISVPCEVAEAVIDGRITARRMTYGTDHRGPIVLVTFGEGYMSGYTSALVQLESVRDVSLEYEEPKGKVFEWRMVRPARLQPLPVRGKLRLYTIPDAKARLCPDLRSKSEPKAPMDQLPSTSTATLTASERYSR